MSTFIRKETLENILSHTEACLFDSKGKSLEWELGYAAAVDDVLKALRITGKDSPAGKDFNLTGYEAMVIDIKERITEEIGLNEQVYLSDAVASSRPGVSTDGRIDIRGFGTKDCCRKTILGNPDI